MKGKTKKRLFKTIKITFGVFFGLLLLLVLIPFLFPHAINRKIDQWANSNINGNISFSATRLTFFKHFPSLTLTMENVAITGAAPFEHDTLILAKDISLGLDLSSVLKKKITVNKIFLNEAAINIQVDSDGTANYNLYKKQKQVNTQTQPDSAGASLGIKKIIIKNSRIVYNDQSIPMTINARGFNYTGSGDLSKDIFDLNTHTEIQSFDFYFNKQPYILSKKINADLVTEINTKTFAFVFRKNNLMINQLPVAFNGRFGFLKDGYDMNLLISSNEKDIQVIISALPPEYQELLKKTELTGLGNIQVALAGKYIANKSMPDLSFNLNIRKGSINTQKSPFPLQNLHIDMQAKLPGLNPDSLTVNIDTLHFTVADGYVNSVLRVKGIQAPEIFARLNAEVDLEKWHKALGILPFSFKGWLSMNFQAEGKFAREIVHKGLRTVDTEITSIPKFTLKAGFKEGYFKYNSLPGAIQDISFKLVADCPDNNYHHINAELENLNVSAYDNYIKGYFKLGNTTDFPIDAQVKAKIRLDEVKQFYPIDSFDLKGDLDADITAKGNYQPDQKKYPVIAASMNLVNGYVKTKYYPDPVKDIQFSVNITDSSESLKGLNVLIKPLTFNFEDEPFLLKARLQDFTDLQYKIRLKGNLDIGKIYKVFAKKGYNVTGIIGADVSLKGRQSDATSGNYDNLDNKGSITVEDVVFSTDIYPKPFVISSGTFSFNLDKIRLDSFNFQYANSTAELSGEASNVIDYIIKPGAVLKGDFDLKSDGITVDDFMSALPDTTHTPATAVPAQGVPSSGVILVPKNLNLDFTAEVKQVRYSDMVVNDAKGHLTMRNDSILLEETGFNLIDAPIEMDAEYTTVNTQKAFFDYHISAQDFDVQKAYKNIKLFRDIATSAEHAQGLISLDYQLSGYLNSAMKPIYPSLKGGGTLTAEKIKMKGFKLFESIGRETHKDSLGGDADVSKISIKSTIANNIITIEHTKMRIPPFRASFGGQVSFDKSLNLDFRLGLPPGGRIGIPLTITGTEDAPKIQMRKGKEADTIQEVVDED